MTGRWTSLMAQHTAAQLAEPRGMWGRVTGAVMNRVNAEINHQAIELLGLTPPDHVLEIGFGGGKTLPILLRKASAGRVAGVELSHTMLAAAQVAHAAAQRADRLVLVGGDASALPWPANSFDKALTVNTLYFWDAPVAVLVEIRRILRPNGRFVLAYRPKALMDRLPTTAYGFRTYTDDAVLAVLHEAGFEVVEMKFGGRRGHEHTCVVALPL